MSRITAPVSKVSRAFGTASSRSGIIEAQRSTGARLMPKYDELLRSRRSSEHTDSSRHLYTAHRPTPQPSLANRSRPLMQTFSSASTAAPTANLDAAVLPDIHEITLPEGLPRMPLLPDNYTTHYAQETPETPNVAGTIVASNPDVVVAGAPLASIEGVSIDGVELKFAHDNVPPAEGREDGGSWGDVLRGMVDNALFSAPKKTA